MAFLSQASAATRNRVQARLPNGEVRTLGIGVSARLTKAVVEDFATRFLRMPVVVWISESGQKVYDRDQALTQKLGLQIDVGRLVPDLILADPGHDPQLMIFVEVVATDGPITEARRRELERLAAKAEYDPEHLMFGTAYADRSAGAFKKTFQALATGSFAWCAAEPDILIILGDASNRTPVLAEMISGTQWGQDA
jgi:BsuBI/PstI restriction endonuclease domain